MSLVYAIDFGTSNSLLAAALNGKEIAPVPLDPFSKDPTVLRTLLYFPTAAQVFYGNQAISEFEKNDLQGRFIRSIKKYLPIRSFIGTYVDNRPLNLEDIIGVFLGEVRRRANAHFGQDVKSVVLGRPARFAAEDVEDQFAERRLRRAAELAGFESIEFFAEPLAAALDLKRSLKEPKRVLVADFGGGTSDFTVLELRPGVFKKEDVLGLGGVSLAGDAYDGSIMRHKVAKHLGANVTYQVPFGSNVLSMPKSLMEQLCSPADFSLLRKRDVMDFFKTVQQWSLGEEDHRIMNQLFTVIEDNLAFKVFEAIEAAKRLLSEEIKAKIDFEYPDVEIHELITRKEFEEGSQNVTEKILGCLDETLLAAQLKPDEVDLVYCTGGTARNARLQKELLKRFGKERLQSQNFFHSIVHGLAVRASELG